MCACAGGACLIACAVLLMPAAILTAMAAVALLLSFTLLTLLVRHGFQPHTAPRSGSPPGTFAAFCRQMVHPDDLCKLCFWMMHMHTVRPGLDRQTHML